MRERYVVDTSCVCAWWTELKTNEREALGGDINGAKREHTARERFGGV